MNKKILFLVLLITVLALPLGTYAVGEFCAAIVNIENIARQVGTSIVVIGWVIAGILYLTSIGSPEKMGTARKALFAAVIGTILVLVAGLSVGIVKDALGTGTWMVCPGSNAK